MKRLLLLLAMACGSAAAAEGGEANANPYVDTEPVIVRLKDGNYISFKPALKVDPGKGDILRAHLPVVRHLMIKSIMGENAANAQTPEFMKSFSESVTDDINKAIGRKYVKDIFFTEWTVQ